MANFSKSDLIEKAWELTKKHFWFLVGITALFMFVSVIPNLFGQENESEPFVITLAILTWILQSFISLGVINIIVKIARGKKVSWGDLWNKRFVFWRYLGGSIIYSLIFVVVAAYQYLYMLFLFYNPGNIAINITLGLVSLVTIIFSLFLSIKLQFYPYLLVDKEITVPEAFKQSWIISHDNWWNLFFYNILLSLVVILGFILLIVGLFATTPIAWLGFALVYVKLDKLNSKNLKAAENI